VVNYHKDRSSESSTLGDELEKKCSSMIQTWEHEKPTQYEFGVAEVVLLYKAIDKFAGLLGTGISDSKKVEAWQAYMNSKETIDGKEVFVVQEEIKQSINTIKKITSRNLDSLTNISVQRFRDSYVVYQSAHQELKEKLNKEIVKPGLSEERITIKIRIALNGPLLELIKQADDFDAALDMQKQKPVGDELEKNYKKLIDLANDKNLTLDRLKNEIKKTIEIAYAGKDAYEQINKAF
jgi:thymidylate kinase